MTELLNRLYDIEREIDNLYILNQSSIVINDVCITGCTLWSKPTINIPKFIVRIYGMNTEIYEKKFNKTIELPDKDIFIKVTDVEFILNEIRNVGVDIKNIRKYNFFPIWL